MSIFSAIASLIDRDALDRVQEIPFPKSRGRLRETLLSISSQSVTKKGGTRVLSRPSTEQRLFSKSSNYSRQKAHHDDETTRRIQNLAHKVERLKGRESYVEFTFCTSSMIYDS